MSPPAPHGEVPGSAQEAVLCTSEPLPASTPVVRGFEFPPWPPTGAAPPAVDYERLLEAMATTGFQATAFGDAVGEIKRMLAWRLSDELPGQPGEDAADVQERHNTRCKIFLGCTSNLVSSGVRESIRYLVQHRMIDVLVTTAGGVEEDLIKCLRPTYVGDFHLAGAGLRARGLNRAGNLLIPNSNYCAFEDWVMPILDAMHAEQPGREAPWTPSAVIRRLGQEIDHPDSICYWAARNGIPIYCPALTDGSLGDMLYFHSYRTPGLVIDLVGDIRAVNDEALHVRQPAKTGIIILGGGVAKHHVANANLMRNGADFAVYVNTAHEFDGSDSGARPDEAVSWGKIRTDARPVKLSADATLVFPLLVAQTFAKHWQPVTPAV